MNDRDLHMKEVRDNQAKADNYRRQQAAKEMQEKTVMQGRKYAFDHVANKIDSFTSEKWRTAAKIVFPPWYNKLWGKTRLLILFLAQWVGIIIPWFFLVPVQRRIAQVLYRGGHTAKIGPGPSEWCVRILIRKWYTPVYQCDMDVRNGRVTEVFEPKPKLKGGDCNGKKESRQET